MNVLAKMVNPVERKTLDVRAITLYFVGGRRQKARGIFASSSAEMLLCNHHVPVVGS